MLESNSGDNPNTSLKDLARPSIGLTIRSILILISLRKKCENKKCSAQNLQDEL